MGIIRWCGSQALKAQQLLRQNSSPLCHPKCARPGRASDWATIPLANQDFMRPQQPPHNCFAQRSSSCETNSSRNSWDFCFLNFYFYPQTKEKQSKTTEEKCKGGFCLLWYFTRKTWKKNITKASFQAANLCPEGWGNRASVWVLVKVHGPCWQSPHEATVWIMF